MQALLSGLAILLCAAGAGRNAVKEGNFPRMNPGSERSRLSAKEAAPGEAYNETYRPQFHFTARTNWLNDPNGLVWYRGEYHLFFQHNPSGIDWGNMTWGHAVSKDLVHWKQLPNALEPDALGTMFSGSAAVDWENTTGLQAGREKTLVTLYTAAGDTSPESKGKPFTQCLAYSNDRGRIWHKYAQNPVVPHIVGGNRDPKIVWHAPTHHWIMALYLDGDQYALLASPDLKSWTQIQTLALPGCSECPDFFEIPVEGDASANRWVFTAANGHYLVGTFDGKHFTSEGGPYIADYGANYYAVQTYSDIPETDGRRIQIAWMQGGKYPHMPFNQQMSFPCQLTLRPTAEGLRLYRWPVREILKLATRENRWGSLTVRSGEEKLLSSQPGELWDIEAEFALQSATAFGLRVGSEEIRYDVPKQTLSCLGKTAPLLPENNRVRIRVLADRSSLEVFGNGGRVSLTSCFLPKERETTPGIFAEGGDVKLVSIKARALKSAWDAP